MKKNLIQLTAGLFKSRVFKNSFWGIAANGLQTILLSLFFVIVARKYTTGEFAFFLIANTIYQFLAGFSSLGLGQWFTREVVNTPDKQDLLSRFLKMQLYSGAFFLCMQYRGSIFIVPRPGAAIPDRIDGREYHFR